MAPPPTRTSLLLLLLIHVQVPILAPVRQIDATPSSLFGSNRTPLAHVISRPFRANRFFGCFPGLKPWAESYSPCGAKKHPKRPYLRAIRDRSDVSLLGLESSSSSWSSSFAIPDRGVAKKAGRSGKE